MRFTEKKIVLPLMTVLLLALAITSAIYGQSDSCRFTPIRGDGAIHGDWSTDCSSAEQDQGYARYYTFTLAESGEVTVTLESEGDAYLYLRSGEATSGGSLNNPDEDDDAGEGPNGTNSQVEEFLDAGTYTIEATTYGRPVTASFTLIISGISQNVAPTPTPLATYGPSGTTPPPPPSRLLSLSTSNDQACVLWDDGYVDCWAVADVWQADQPSNLTFTHIASSDYHTCGLLQDGPVICWGAAVSVPTPTPMPTFTPDPTPKSGTDLAVSLWTGNHNVTPGEEMAIEYTVVNHGPLHDQGVALEFSGSPLFTTLAISPESLCINNVCNLGALGPNESISGTVTVVPEVHVEQEPNFAPEFVAKTSSIKRDLNQANNKDSLQFTFPKNEPGFLRWSVSIPQAGKPASGPPIIGEEAVFIGAGNEIYALSKSTGQEIWIRELKDVARTIAVHQGSLIVDDGDIYSLTQTDGKVNWRFATGVPWVGAQLVGDTIYLISLNAPFIYALDATTGKLLWDYIPESSGWVNTAMPIGDDAFYISYRDSLISLDPATGEVQWEFEAEGNPYLSIEPAIADRKLYFIAGRDVVYVLDKNTGEELIVRKASQLSPPDGNKSEHFPLLNGILSDDRLYLVVNELDVVALDPDMEYTYWYYKFQGEAGLSSFLRYIGEDRIYLVMRRFSSIEVNEHLNELTGLYALDTADGTLSWHRNVVVGDHGAATGLHRDVVYLSPYGGDLETLDAVTGEPRRRFKNSGTYASISFTISEGVLYGLDGSYVFALTAEN